jgi:DNA-binding IclR family transcriptional regulator
VLEALLTSPDGLRLTEVAERTGIHKTTALRLLRSLAAIGVVRRVSQGERYEWDAVRWLSVVSKVREGSARVDAVQAVLDELAASTGETVGLSYPDIDGRNALCVVATVPSNPVRVDPGDRNQWPMHATAAGKMYLACLPLGDRRAYAEGSLVGLTEKTITSPAALLAELEVTRERGYALTRGEAMPCAGALAVPIWNEGREVAACLQVTSPVRRLTAENIERWLPLLRESAGTIGEILYPEVAAGSTAQETRSVRHGEGPSRSADKDKPDVHDARQQYRVV